MHIHMSWTDMLSDLQYEAMQKTPWVHVLNVATYDLKLRCHSNALQQFNEQHELHVRAKLTI